MEEPRTITGTRILLLGILAIVIAVIVAGTSYRGETSAQLSAVCLAVGGAALVLGGSIVLAAERRRS